MEMRQWISCDPGWGRGEVIWEGGGAKRGKVRISLARKDRSFESR